MHALTPFADVVAEVEPKLRHTNFLQYKNFVQPWIEGCTHRDLSGFNIYALFREPTEWLYSWYRFRQRAELADRAHPNHREYTGEVSWPEFLRAALAPHPEPFALVGRQSTFVVDADGKVGPNQLFTFDQLSLLLAELSQRVGQPLKTPRFNVSVDLGKFLNEADYLYCREHLTLDYDIYDGLTATAAHRS